MTDNRLMELLPALAQPFSPKAIKWLPQVLNKDKTRAMAVPYVQANILEDRLDEVCPGQWAVTFRPWGDVKIICDLTIAGVTRSSTGESRREGDRNPGTSAEQQAFKRACARFGIGRYLRQVQRPWMPVKQQGKSYVFTDEALHRLNQFAATGERPSMRQRPAASGDRKGKGEPPKQNGQLTEAEKLDRARAYKAPGNGPYPDDTLGQIADDPKKKGYLTFLAGQWEPQTDEQKRLKEAARYLVAHLNGETQ